MLGSPGFDMKLEFHLTDLQTRAVAGVEDFDHVCVVIGDDLRGDSELTRSIRQRECAS